MSVKIRLRRMGAKGRPFYRLVVADSRTARNGRFIEVIGYYDPMTEPVTLKVDGEKAAMWLGRGAQPSDTARALLKKEGILDTFLGAKQKAPESAPAAVEEAQPEEETAPSDEQG
ncbi:MAG: 30S ribosomal protein S16 [Armatimonadetes bacterium]|nr:30S ribosomal protein S16 [Armatimonadota bacterium]